MSADARRNLEDIYELSPLQEGMLFHHLSAPGSGLYCEQMSFDIEGELDGGAFDRAWQQVVGRHPALRTSFQWEGLDKPLQVVHRSAAVPIEHHEAALGTGASDESLRRLAAAERERGFELGRAPLMRVALVRTGAARRHVIWTHSHLLLDGWCLPLLLRELTEAYAALAKGEAPKSAARRPYRDFIGWLRGRDETAAKAFWSEALRGFEEATPVPGVGAFAGGAGQVSLSRRSQAETDALAYSGKAGETFVDFSAEESAGLGEWCRRERVTVSTLCQGGWALALARMTGRSDVVFGTTVAGRPADLPGADEMIGLFINTLPSRAVVDPAAAPGEWLRSLQASQAAARGFEHTPLVKIREWSEIPQDTELFETLFAFENYPAGEGGSGGIKITGVRAHERTHYPLTVAAAVVEGRLGARVLYDGGRVERAAAEAIAEKFRTAVLALAAAGARRLGEIDLISGEERERLLGWGNANGRRERTGGSSRHSAGGDGRAGTPVPTWLDLFDRHAAETPHAPALIFGKETVSYGELDARARRAAARLRALGAGPERRVAICLERSLDLAIAVLAVLKAGAAYVPLDPSYPQDRLEGMAEDSGATLVLAHRSSASRFGGRVVAAWEDVAAGTNAAGVGAGPAASPENLAYVIYTSGSTGKPKGVMIEHAKWAKLAEFQAQVCGLGPGDRVLQFSSISFDASVWEISLALSSGAALVLAPRAELLPGEPLAATLREQGISCVLLPPSALAHLPAEEFPRLRVLIAGGEASWPELVARWAPGRKFINAYGPTENTVVATWAECGPEAAAPPIGSPVPYASAYVLGPDGTLAPIGVAGELHIAGEGLSRGYLDRPELTAERFIPNPFGPTPGGRLYRTGDLVRWRPDGRLDYLGRVDRQVKVRGFRIEPGEVEAALAAHPDVREAAVDARRGPEGEAELVAWVALRTGVAENAGALRSWLAGRLPAHFVPGAWAFVPALPLTGSGKVDKAALPEPERAREGGAGRSTFSPLVELVAGAFAEVLGTDRVGPDDNFFELGGHSLVATRLVARLRERAAPQLSLRAVFETPTPAGLAETIAAERGGVMAAPIGRRAAGAEAPASLAQQRFWVLERLTPGSAANLIQFAVRVRGKLDRGRLERALGRLAERHEPLRTGIEEPADQALAGRTHPLRLVPAAWTGALAADDWRAGLAEDAAALFDLAKGPLWRVRIASVGPDEHVLAFTFHHAVFDGWSEGVMVRELGELYAGKELPDLAIGYGDYAQWQRTRASDGELGRQVEAWKEELRGLPALELPTDAARPSVQTHRGGAVRSSVDGVEAGKLRAVARAEGATLFMVLLAAWETWLWRHSGQMDFGVGVPVAGRTRRDIEGMIGLFVNTVVIRSDVAEGMTFGTLVRRVRERTLRAYDRQEAPFEQVVDAAQPQRDVSRSPLFQVMFTLQNAPRAGLEFGDLKIEPLEIEATSAKFELTLSAGEEADGTIGLSLEYNKDLFGENTAERFLWRYVEILEAAGAPGGAKARLRDLRWVPEREREEVARWSRERTGPLPESTLVALFEAQVARRPDAIAITQEVGTSVPLVRADLGDVRSERTGGTPVPTSYRQLNERANRLAHLLIARGIGPEDVVAICLPRSLEMIVAVLGVLKAGAAYLPLDPDYPAERLAFMLEDGRPAALVSLAGCAPKGPARAGRILLDDAESVAGLERSPAANPAQGQRVRALRPQHPAYVIYTSGSTGTPKGVVISHQNVVRLFSATDAWFKFGADEVWTLFHSYTFDFSVWELWGPLLHGGRLVVVSYLTSRSPADFLKLLAREGVTVLNQTPSAFYQLAQADRENPELGQKLALRRIIFGGEALGLDRLADWYSRHPADAPVLVNMYGITETTVHVTCLRLDEEIAAGGGHSLIGTGIPDLRVHVLDADLRPVPAGVAGELHVAGAGLARGYLHRPGLTAERFVPDPLGEAGGRMYRSGDVAKWRTDGGLDYLGRCDDQVKIRGFRVELGEIEAALARHPSVDQAGVIAREDQPGLKRLVGYVVAAAGQAIDAGALRLELGRLLPDYMVPAVIVVLEALPLTSNGKLDRKALPEPPAPASAGGAAPQGPIEEFIGVLWCELLGVESVSRDDNFFVLGGHSLLATQFISRLREQLDVEVPLIRLFEDPTPAGCARAAAESGAPGHAEKYARARLRLRAMPEAEKERLRAGAGVAV